MSQSFDFIVLIYGALGFWEFVLHCVAFVLVLMASRKGPGRLLVVLGFVGAFVLYVLRRGVDVGIEMLLAAEMIDFPDWELVAALKFFGFDLTSGLMALLVLMGLGFRIRDANKAPDIAAPVS